MGGDFDNTATAPVEIGMGRFRGGIAPWIMAPTLA
jgi:hypothetical protein